MYEHIFNQAITALVDERCPDYANRNQEEVLKAFRSIFSGSDIDPIWLEMFKTKVHDWSFGTRRVESIIDVLKEWPCLIIKGQAHYMKLVDVYTQKTLFYFHIGPYGTPIKIGSATVETLLRQARANGVQV